MTKTRGNKQHQMEVAVSLYVEGKMTNAEIAEFVGVTQHTIGRWSRDNDWDEIRANENLTSQKLAREYYYQSDLITQLARTENRPLTSKEADVLSKLAAAIEKIDKKINPHIIMSVFMEYNEWLTPLDLAFSKKNVEYQKVYLQQRGKQYAKG